MPRGTDEHVIVPPTRDLEDEWLQVPGTAVDLHVDLDLQYSQTVVVINCYISNISPEAPTHPYNVTTR